MALGWLKKEEIKKKTVIPMFSLRQFKACILSTVDWGSLYKQLVDTTIYLILGDNINVDIILHVH